MKRKTKKKDCIICFGEDKACKACNGSGQYFPALTSKVIQEMINKRISEMTPKQKLTTKDMKREINVLIKVLLYMRKGQDNEV